MSGPASISPSPEASVLFALEKAPGISPKEDFSGGEATSPPDEQEINRLRQLLFHREIALIDELRTRLTNPGLRAEETSAIIAEALVLRSAKDDKLGIALEPLVDSIVRDALRTNPQAFTNALFPLMGPSIRKSIAESFHAMLESFSKTMEMSFSWKGLRWRLEALRTGKSFSEVVLLHTLIYRVEEIFFIHSATGIDIVHLVNEGVDSQDASMVSAMLTAIQDFVSDSLRSGGEGELEALRHGERSILLERHPTAYLACVVRGSPPADFREQMRSCLEHILVEYAVPLSRFDGDTAPLAGCRARLERLLTSRYADEGKPLSLWFKVLIAAALLGLLGGIGFWLYADYKAGEQSREAAEKQRLFRAGMQAALALLRDEPGLMVLHVEPRDPDPWEVLCLKDNLARSPEEVLRGHSLDPAAFLFRSVPYISYEAPIVRKRVDEAIRPPEGVALRFGADGVLHLSGMAPMEWILRARETAMVLPGVREVDIREITDPRTERLMAMIRLVNGTVVEFPSGKDTPLPQDIPRLTRAVETLAELNELARSMGMAASLTIYGHADATGTEKRNYEISQNRARTIAAMLYAKGSSLPITLYGMGSEYADPDKGKAEDQASRRIELKVHLVQAANPNLGDYLREEEKKDLQPPGR
ncbi:MAG: OmpA family protein [Desulfovibrio sp.]|jgi:OOP family OmpA-OmpF porin|nr:OmpA family protein [Desulfovibrio sp.]